MFYDRSSNGEMNQGIGRLAVLSLVRVAKGFPVAILVDDAGSLGVSLLLSCSTR